MPPQSLLGIAFSGRVMATQNIVFRRDKEGAHGKALGSVHGQQATNDHAEKDGASNSALTRGIDVTGVTHPLVTRPPTFIHLSWSSILISV